MCEATLPTLGNRDLGSLLKATKYFSYSELSRRILITKSLSLVKRISIANLKKIVKNKRNRSILPPGPQ